MWYWKQTVTALFVRLPGPAGVERAGFWTALRVDVAAAVRGLTRRPMQSCTAVLTLGLGIGVAGTAFSILNGTVLRGLPFEEADRLVHFERANHEEDRPSMAVTPHDYVAWRETQSTFEDLGAYVEATALLPVEGAPPERYVGVRISANSFPLLRVAPALGRSFTPDDERAGGPEVVLLSHVLWLNRFGGDPGVVGREIRLNDTPTTVIGVMPERFGFPIAERFWLPLRLDLEAITRGSGRLDVFGRLADGVAVEAARAEFDQLSRQLQEANPDTNRGVVAVLRSFHDEYVGEEFTRTTYRMLMGALLVLFVCCANVANLLLIGGTRRRQALALRVALGATRARIARQLVAEAAALAAAGAVVGIAIAWYGVEWFDRAGAQAGVFSLPHGSDSLFWWDVGLDAPTLLFVIGMAGMTAVLAGVVPAFRVSGAAAGGLLSVRTRGSLDSGSGHFANSLVVAQLALTTGLLVAAGFVARSGVNVAAADDAFETDGVFVTRVDIPFSGNAYATPQSRLAFAEQVLEQLSARPEFVGAAIGTRLPLATPPSSPFRIEGAQHDASQPEVGVVSVSPDYFRVFGVALLEGRAFDLGDRLGASPVAVVNRTFVDRYITGRAAVGTRLRLGDADGDEPWMTVVGVVPDLWDRPLDPGREAGVYLPLSQSGMGDLRVRLGRLGLYYQTVIVRARTGATAVPAVVRDQIYQVDGSLPVLELSTMQAVVAQRMGRFRIWGRLYLAFALAGLLLASMGVYGVLTFGVAQRTSEIGVRRALGATSFSVQRQILGRAGRQIVIGTAMGLFVGWLLSDGMARVLYGVDTTDPLVFASVGGLMALVGLLASWLPARRAAAIDPVEAMRCE